MRKALLIIIVGLVVIVGAAYLLLPQQKPAPPQTQTGPKNQSAHAKSWNGSISQVYNATFVRQGRELTLIEADYSWANTPQTDVALKFTTPLDQKYGVPHWLTPRAFVVRSTDGEQWYPVWHPQIQGAQVTFTLQLSKLPTGKLAANDLGLVVRIGGEPFSIGLALPAPPPGHRYAEMSTRPDVTPPTLALFPVGRHSFRVIAHDDVKLAKVVVNIRGAHSYYYPHGTRFAHTFRMRHPGIVRAVARDAAGHLSTEKVLRVR